MDLQEVIKRPRENFCSFVPKTQTLNKDREYFISESFFIKRDFNKARAAKEAEFLKKLQDFTYFPKFIELNEYRGFSEIIMGKIDGKSIENLKDTLNLQERLIVCSGLLSIFNTLRQLKIVHGDINESNLLYNREKQLLFLIDFEYAVFEDSDRDLTGPNWGVYHIFNYLK